MKTPSLTIVVLAFLIGISTPTPAQYPKVPSDVQAATNALLKETHRLADEAWERALPVIEQEARQGKPYVPWAARPTDLPDPCLSV